MADQVVEEIVRKLDRQMDDVLQILPTLATKAELAEAQMAAKDELAAAVARLATKDELAAAVARLATKDELAAAVAPLATKAELAAEGERSRRHMDVVAENLLDAIRLSGEWYTALEQRDREQHAAVTSRLDAVELDVAVLKSKRRPRRAS
jgi:hypothetical protein